MIVVHFDALILKLFTFSHLHNDTFYVLLYRLHVLLAISWNQTPRCKTFCCCK